MFSTGQLIFAAVFVFFFAIVIFLSYRKDKNLHSKNYKGVKWVGIVFIVFIIILFILKEWLKS